MIQNKLTKQKVLFNLHEDPGGSYCSVFMFLHHLIINIILCWQHRSISGVRKDIRIGCLFNNLFDQPSETIWLVRAEGLRRIQRESRQLQQRVSQRRKNKPRRTNVTFLLVQIIKWIRCTKTTCLSIANQGSIIKMSSTDFQNTCLKQIQFAWFGSTKIGSPIDNNLMFLVYWMS